MSFRTVVAGRICVTKNIDRANGWATGAVGTGLHNGDRWAPSITATTCRVTATANSTASRFGITANVSAVIGPSLDGIFVKFGFRFGHKTG